MRSLSEVKFTRHRIRRNSIGETIGGNALIRGFPAPLSALKIPPRAPPPLSRDRFALSDFYSSGPCTSSSTRGGVLSSLQTGVRVGSSPTPAALLQASRAGARPSVPAGAPAGGGGGVIAGGVGGGGGGGGGATESLQSAVTRGHLEDALSTAVLLGSAEEFVDVLKAYAGHLAKNAGFGDGRFAREYAFFVFFF